jgi:hypothetical protein
MITGHFKVPIVPVSPFPAGAVTMCSGILLFALPIALIGSRFQEAYNLAVSRRANGRSLEFNERTPVQVLPSGYLT